MSQDGFVVIVNPGLDELPGNKLVVRGRLRPDTLQALQSDSYQREIISSRTKILGITKCLQAGTITDIVLGTRGEKYNVLTDGSIQLVNPTFIIDGQQRVNAAVTWMRKDPAAEPAFGAMVYFNSTEEFERDLFQKLNTKGTRVSPSILLRNMEREYVVVKELLDLTRSPGFVLRDRVSWEQNMHRDKLITAAVFASTIGYLHSHLGSAHNAKIDESARSLQAMYDKIGPIFIANVRVFFDLIEDCWGLRNVAYREGASYIKGNFLASLAILLSDHPEFWNGMQLVIPREIKAKLKKFPISDPQVVKFSGAGHQARGWLNDKLVVFINSGKRTRRLVSRYASAIPPEVPDAAEADAPESAQVSADPARVPNS